MEEVTDPRVYSNRYQVTHLIARGGMALVYRAHDLLLNRYVALKILYAELSVDKTFVERFRREAQAAANLSHPNIVPIFDWGEDNGTYFIVMELIDGTSLADLLSQNRTLTPIKSAQVCAQVASALSYAHRQGVVHRDVKPGNILLTDDGQVKVTDFGIAQAISTEDNLTLAGSVMGTATYFSPEQAEGATVDGRSDVYSLGVVLYELCAGRPPFMGETPVAVASKHVRDVAPSPKQFNPSLPSDLEAIVMHALAKRPEDRYVSADAFRSDLLRFVEGQPVSAVGKAAVMGDDVTRAVAKVNGGGNRTQSVAILPGPRTDIRRRHRRRWPWITGLVIFALLLAGAGFGAWWYVSHRSFTMPNVRGETLNAAVSKLARDGLVPNTVGVDSSKPVDIVTDTSPKAGRRVTKGQSVTVWYSNGPSAQLVTVPPVSGESLGQAEAQLSAAGLGYTPNFTTVNPEGDAPGTVISQSPDSGTSAKAGSVVNLVVIAYGSSFPLPDVDGKTVAQAAALLGSYGLDVSSTQGSVCSNTVTDNDVATTTPAAGQPVTSGQTVMLNLSSGPCMVTVPNVTSDTQNEATATLESSAYGLVPYFNELSPTSDQCIVDGPNYVVNTSPAAGTSVLYGSTVTVNYCPPAGNNTTTSTTTTTTTGG